MMFQGCNRLFSTCVHDVTTMHVRCVYCWAPVYC